MPELNSTSILNDVNLQLYLRMEDNANDTTANAYNFTNSNGTFVAGKFGKAADFVAASTQYIYRAAANLAKVLITTTQSWSFWIKLGTFADTDYLFGRSTGGGWFFSCNSGGVIGSGALGLSVAYSVTLPSTGIWHHVAFTYNSSTNKISSFLNGVVVQNQVDVTGSWSAGAGTNFGIGRIGDYAGYGTFTMDDFAMFDKELSITEVQTLYKSRSSFLPFL